MPESLTPLQAIKQKCKEDCSAGQFEEWKNCPVTKCVLHPFRFGKNPFRKKGSGLKSIKNLVFKKSLKFSDQKSE